jgi:D-alanine-D-alanine ligase
MNIGVFFGGKSPEHDVSIITGQLVLSELKKRGHTAIPVYIDVQGDWYCDEKLGELKFFQQADKQEQLKKYEKFLIDMANSRGKLVLVQKKGLLSERKIQIDMAFPAFHGANGEDGTVQGLFEMFNLPYVGCGVAASALAMDKILTKLLYKSQDIPTAKFSYFSKKEWEEKKDFLIEEILQQLKLPLFVKPPLLGSSIGISRVKDKQELECAMEVALHYGENVLIEEGVENLKDLTCAVIGDENPRASLVQESIFGGDFFDYEEKYLKEGGTQLGNADKSIIIPANIKENLAADIQNMAVRIFKIFGCKGMARVDFLYDEKKDKLYANEINTIPGTLYHHLWKASGLELQALVAELIAVAEQIHQRKQKITYSFSSDLLKKAQSVKLQLKREEH